jgi:acetyl esterase/lipase
MMNLATPARPRPPRFKTPSAIDLINALAPRRNVRFIGGLSYGAGPRRGLDLYLPDGIPGPVPIVVFYYGGGWEEGERRDYRFVGAALAARGIMAVLPDYRVYPEVTQPGFMDDGAAVLAWVREHGAGFGGDPARLFLLGHSAGAYIAAMLALHPNWATGDLAGMIGLAGPYDFVPDTPAREAMFPPGDALAAVMPVNHAGPSAPPMLLATGARDRTVLPRNSERLAAALRAHGVPVALRHYRGIGHKLVLGAIARPLQVAAPVLADCLRFIADPGAAT